MRTIDRIAILLITLTVLSLFVIGVFQPAASIYFYVAASCTFCLSFVHRKIIITIISSLFVLSTLLPTYAIYFYIAGGCIFFLDFDPYGLWIKIRHIRLMIQLNLLNKDFKRLLKKYSNQ